MTVFLFVCSLAQVYVTVLHVIHTFMEKEQLFFLVLNFTLRIRYLHGSLAAS